jgi:hypothetical protein
MVAWLAKAAPAATAALTEIDTTYNALTTYIAAHELQTTFRNAMNHWGAVRIRAQSGTYWLDASRVSKARHLAEALSIGSTRMVVLPLYDGVQTDEVRGALADGFEAERRDVLAQLKRLAEGGATVKASTYEARIDELMRIEARVQVAELVLQDRTVALREALAAARRVARKCIDDVASIDWSAALEEV